MKALIKTRSYSDERRDLARLLFAPLLAAALVCTPIAAFASDIPAVSDVQESISPEVAIASVADEATSGNLTELPEIGKAPEDYASPSPQDDFTDAVVNEANLPTELPSALIPSDSEQTLPAADTVAPAADTAANDVVYFNDSGLKRCVAKTLGYSVNAQITTSDLRWLTSLDCSSNSSHDQGKGGPVFDIAPLRYATNLQHLGIYGPQLTNLEPLKGLTGLNTLQLSGARVSDLSPLAGLKNLYYLGIYGESIADISPLKGLTKLERLFIANTSVSDLSPLKGLTKLYELVLHQSRVTDISPLKGLTNLVILDLGGNRIADFSALKGLTKLHHLYIERQTPSVTNRWVQAGTDWWYLDSNGSSASGWTLINGSWYHFMYLGGPMETGWIKDRGSWYYLNPSGAMATGWKQLGGQWYYLSSSGAMKTGWVQTGGAWYYLHASGAMHTGWLQQGKTWYYLKPGGAMVTGNYVINGKVNRFSSSGAWLG